ncbi:MAG: hypothetical protein QOD52_1299, partial [Gaiellaceae bacterium]|nr:hypothetical protein [Gaiellaceae bacterium]
VVVVVVEVVVVRFVCPRAVAAFPWTGVVAVFVRPRAAPERPGEVVVLVVLMCPGATADLPCAAGGVVFVAAPAVVSTGAGSAGTRSSGVGAAGCGR